MLFLGHHKELAPSLETIGAAFAVFEWHPKVSSAELVSANRLFEQVTGRLVSGSVGSLLSAIVPHYVEKQMRSCLEHCVKTHGPQEVELVIEQNGSDRWWRMMASPVIPSEHTIQRVIVTLIEISEKKLLETELNLARQRYAAVVETAFEGIISVDETQTITLMNDAAKSIFGVAAENVIGTNLACFMPLRFRDKHPEYISSFRKSAVASRPMQNRVPVLGLRADGSEFPIEVTISKIAVGAGVEMTAVVRDVSERTRLMDELSLAATHDSLTGVFNRRHCSSLLKSEIARCDRFDQQFSVVMFDIDHFKMVNDQYGHPAGDKVLVALTQLAQKALREIDVLCRWGGEEFVVVLPGTSTPDAAAMAERIRALFEHSSVDLPGTSPIAVTASFGVASYIGKESTQEVLMDQVDKALYMAKKSGRNCCVVADGNSTATPSGTRPADGAAA